MENLETLATLDTQDTGQINVRENQRAIKKTQSRDTGNIGYTKHRSKTNTTKTQHRKLKRSATRTPSKTGGEPRYLRRISSSCFVNDTYIYIIDTFFL